MARKTKRSETNGMTGKEKTRQIFSLSAPAARSVQLAGDFTHWQARPIPLQKESGDLWRAAVELAPGEYRYRFLVDGQWRDDPECTLRVPNPFGTTDAVRSVRV